ncbi:MAG TPA: 30S ribosomal protein S4 [Fastidiosipila sp.]|nr:30S ribosomal protein S4 [Fastidiosipila sp.]
MARYTDAVCRLCRREGTKLFLKGQRCYTDKCPMSSRRGKRSGQPGMHQAGRRKESEYGMQLRAKQRTKRFYGVLESQFRKTYNRAERMPGKTGENLLSLLELRMDNVVYRLGLAESRAMARQLVTHGHFTLNGGRMDIPSAELKVGDEIQVKENSRKLAPFTELAARQVPGWLSFNEESLKGSVLSVPTREEIDVEVEETLIVELYSR